MTIVEPNKNKLIIQSAKSITIIITSLFCKYRRTWEIADAEQLGYL